MNKHFVRKLSIHPLVRVHDEFRSFSPSETIFVSGRIRRTSSFQRILEQIACQMKQEKYPFGLRSNADLLVHKANHSHQQEKTTDDKQSNWSKDQIFWQAATDTHGQMIVHENLSTDVMENGRTVCVDPWSWASPFDWPLTEEEEKNCKNSWREVERIENKQRSNENKHWQHLLMIRDGRRRNSKKELNYRWLTERGERRRWKNPLKKQRSIESEHYQLKRHHCCWSRGINARKTGEKSFVPSSEFSAGENLFTEQMSFQSKVSTDITIKWSARLKYLSLSSLFVVARIRMSSPITCARSDSWSADEGVAEFNLSPKTRERKEWQWAGLDVQKAMLV